MEPNDIEERIARRYQRFKDAVEGDDPLGAAEEFARVCQTLRRNQFKLPTRTLASFAECFIDFFWQSHRHDLMHAAAVDAEKMFGPDPEWTFGQGESLFYLARFDESRKMLEQLAMEDFDDPMVFYLLACLAERRGEEKEAGRLFQTAHRLDPKGFVIPLSISEERAAEIYRECLAELPHEIQWHIKELPVLVSPFPSEELITTCEPPIDPLVLGLFMGRTLGDPETSWASDQPRILLFHKNIGKIASDPEALDEELRKTLFHEVGHYLGFDEDQLEEMGLA